MLVVTGEIFGCGDINTTKDFKLSHFGDLAGQQSNSGGARDRGLCHLHPFELYPETHPFALLFGGGLIDYPRRKGYLQSKSQSSTALISVIIRREINRKQDGEIIPLITTLFFPDDQNWISLGRYSSASAMLGCDLSVSCKICD